jgi:tRNA modification GTPase
LPQSPETIAAVATGPGVGGIGVVRVSGHNIKEVTMSLIGREIQPRHATLANFLDIDGSTIDQGIAIYYPAPNSYTGEDVLEIQGHGGSAVLQLLLRRCLQAGARIALPGEFTQRAYLNKKLDLVQAESIEDLINATNEQAARSATRSLEGDFSKAINRVINNLIELRIRIEAALDFSEEEIDQEEFCYVDKKFKSILNDLNHVFESAKQGSALRKGAHIALVGQPNVGKSSLLNCLAGDDVALVSEVAGTTRDTIRQEISINGVPFHIIDTAGLRESKDIVEQLGIQRTKEVLKKADVVIILKDVSNENEIEYLNFFELIPNNIPKVHIMNKIDLIMERARIDSIDGDTYIYLSAKTGEGINLLRDKLLNLINWHGESNVFIARERHLQALIRAKKFLNSAGDEMERPELFAEELRLAQEALGEITGEFTSDDLLGEIFSRFCIGK